MNGKGNKDAKCRMQVATFNLRMDTPYDSLDAWPNRKEMVKSLVRFHDFDIIIVSIRDLIYAFHESFHIRNSFIILHV